MAHIAGLLQAIHMHTGQTKLERKKFAFFTTLRVREKFIPTTTNTLWHYAELF